MAYLLLYTDATLEQACAVVRRARSRARTNVQGKANTFIEQLAKVAQLPKIKFADHTRVAIVDGGGGGR